MDNIKESDLSFTQQDLLFQTMTIIKSVAIP